MSKTYALPQQFLAGVVCGLGGAMGLLFQQFLEKNEGWEKMAAGWALFGLLLALMNRKELRLWWPLAAAAVTLTALLGNLIGFLVAGTLMDLLGTAEQMDELTIDTYIRAPRLLLQGAIFGLAICLSLFLLCKLVYNLVNLRFPLMGMTDTVFYAVLAGLLYVPLTILEPQQLLVNCVSGFFAGMALSETHKHR